MRTRTSRRPNKFVMVGNRWFDNGDQWRQTGYDMLVKKKLAKEVDRFNHEKNRKRIIFVDSGYVPRKEDL